MNLPKWRLSKTHPVADLTITLLGTLSLAGIILYAVMAAREYWRIGTIDADEILPLCLSFGACFACFAYIRWRQLKDEIGRRSRAEQTLEESEKKYRDLMENAPVGIVVSSFEGNVLEVNDALVRMHGYESKEEFLKSRVSDRFSDPKDRERLVASVWDSGKADGFEVESRRKDGSTFWTATTAVPRTATTGEQQLVGVVQDVTKRKAAEDALRTSELKYRSLFTHMMEGFARCRMIFQGGQPWDFEYLDVNARFEELTGLHDVVGKRVSDVIPGIRESNPELLEAYGRVALTGNPEKIETYLAPQGAWYSVSIYSPQKEYFVAVFGVITERKRAEVALRQSEVRYRDLADSISDVFFAMDRDMRYTYWNKASEKLTGIKATEALGKDFFDIFPENEVTTRLRDIYLEAIATRRAQHLITAYPGGKSLIHEISAYPSDLGLCVFVKDITEREEAQTALKESEVKFRDLAEQSPNMIFINRNSRIVYANRRCVEIMGYGLDELYSPDFDMLTLIAERCRAMVTANLKVHAEGREVGPYEYSLVTKDGAAIDCILASKLVNYEGAPAILGTATDITELKKAEAMLAEVSLHQEAILAAVPDIIMEVDKDKVYRWANQAGVDFFGHGAIGKKAADYFGEQQNTNDVVEPVFEGGDGTVYVENWQRRKDGQRRLLAWWRRSLKDGQGKVIGALSAAQDITDRRAAEEALKKSELSLSEAQIAGKIGHWEFDLATRKITWSDELFELFERGRLMGPPSPEEDLACYSPAEVARLEQLRRRVTTSDETVHYDVEARLPSGRSIYLSSTLRRVKGKNGEAVGLFGTAQDITSRKKAEQALVTERENFRSSVELSPFGIQIITFGGEVVYSNRTMLDMWGFGSFEELKAIPRERRFTPDSVASIAEKNKLLKRGEIPSPYEVTILCRAGVTRDLQAHSKEIVWNGERLVQMLYEDVTERKQAERALRESEQKYRDLVENLPVGIVITSMDGRVIEVNKTLAQMHGYDSKAKFANSAVADRFYDLKDRERWVASLRQKGKTDGFEIKTKRRDGSLFWTSLTSIPRTAETGEQQLITVSQDITERKTAEDALLFKNALLEAQAESTAEGILAGDDENRIVLFNRRFLELWHVPEGLIETRDAGAVLRHTLTLVDDPESFMRRVADLSERRDEKGEDIIDLRDGRAISRYSSPLVDANGAYRGRIWYFRDITEPRRMREKIEHAAEEWRRTFDSITEAVSIQDKDFKLVRVNRAYADMFGMKPQELLGRSCYELVHGTDCPMEGCPHLKTMQTGAPAGEEFFEPHLGIHLEVTTSPIFNGKGDVEGTVLVARDITKRREMEQKLLLSDRLASIGELAAGVAHEVNNPLTTVIGFSELLLEKMTTDEARNDLVLVHNEAKRAAAIVRNLLTFARQHELVKQPTRIEKVIEDVLKLRAYEQKVSNIEVITRFATDLPEIVVDYFQMHQVFLNLVINAEYFMKESHGRGTLTLVTARKGDMVRISIADDGPGIRAKNLRHVFDPFFTTKKVGKGTGLGLSICHGIVTEHGGRIYAESETGGGATFVVDLPIG